MDVRLFHTPDGGDICIAGNGSIELSGGLESMAYLCLFGGNEDDNGRDDRKTWWGNIDEDVKYISETQHVLQSLPATSNNINKVRDAAIRDLNDLIDRGVASSVSVNVTIPKINTISIHALIDGEDIIFTENWRYDYNQAN